MKKVEGEKVWRQVGNPKLKGRQGSAFSSSSASVTQVKLSTNSKKMDGHGTTNLPRSKRVSLSDNQPLSTNSMKMDGHGTTNLPRSNRVSLSDNQPSSSSNKVCGLSSPHTSQGSISPPVFECQRMQTPPEWTVETDRERDYGSEPKEGSLNINGTANLTEAALDKTSSNRVKQSTSPSSSQGSTSPQLVGSPQMQTSPRRIVGADSKIFSSSSCKFWKSSPSHSQESVELVEHQQGHASKGITDADRESRPKSEPEEDFFRNLTLSSSSNKFGRPLSPTLILGSVSPQLGKQQQMRNSYQGIVPVDRRSPPRELEESPFDICRVVNSALVKLKKPLHLLNKEKKRDVECAKHASWPEYLRSGMVLLKNSISHIDQVKIVNKCRELGIGFGGFYRPGYEDGAKLHLQMMCLGKNWDPQSRLYGDSRLFDNAVPPEIPVEFKNLVDKALHEAHSFLKQSGKSVAEIPNMTPDICIVNFYNSSGKLGLHQDQDERKESLKKGLPVISFSIGDSAEFLYSDERAGEAEKVVLESGDVLIFGGKSRHIFHGVTCIKSNTAPGFLADEAHLRPGRLNLTFRQY